MTTDRVRLTALATALIDCSALAQSLRFWMTEKLAARKLAVAMAAIILASPNLSVAEGALAIGNQNGVGLVVNRSTQAEADNEALNICARTDYGCSIVMRFSNVCAAYAVGGTARGWATNSDRTSASNQAVSECRSLGGNCSVSASGCDGG